MGWNWTYQESNSGLGYSEISTYNRGKRRLLNFVASKEIDLQRDTMEQTLAREK